ncbi:MAG: glycosyltransferase [Anaerolineae bacterium]
MVPPGDPQRLAAAIVEILCNPTTARRMGEAAYQRALNLFDAERNATATVALYEEII